MKICPKCSCENDDGNNFCKKCGEKFPSEIDELREKVSELELKLKTTNERLSELEKIVKDSFVKEAIKFIREGKVENYEKKCFCGATAPYLCKYYTSQYNWCSWYGKKCELVN